MQKSLTTSALFLASITGLAQAQATNGIDSQNIKLSGSTEIPGTNLEPGNYTFSVEDRLTDRAIVRINRNDKDEHYLLLAVPNPEIKSNASNGLVYYTEAGSGSQAIRGWKCASCSSGLEFVYPKLEAVKITGESAQAVLAVDPSSDKLPENLSPDDMKVVTLWLLAPKKISADHHGEGVDAKKYVAAASVSGNPASSDTKAVQTATAELSPAAVPERKTLPHTAGHTSEIGLGGLFALLAAFGLKVTKRRLIA